MIYLKKFNSFNESLKPSQYRTYMSEWDSLKKRYDDKFKELKSKYDGDKNAYRIYIPVESKKEESKTQKEISELLSKNNIDIIDYISGQAKHKDARNSKRIGQILTNIESRTNDLQEKEYIKKLMKDFIEDPIRKSGLNNEDLLVCISRHPYDIAGADTDRNWTNCMTIGDPDSKRISKLENELKDLEEELKTAKGKRKSTIENKIEDLIYKIDARKEDGLNIKYLIYDVKEGSLIAYLIKSSDKNIQHPLGNISIKPYINEKDPNDILLVADKKMYGQEKNKPFRNAVNKFLLDFNGNKKGNFILNPNLYNDNRDEDLSITL